MSLPEKDIQAIFKCYDEERYQDAKDLLDKAADQDMNNHHAYYLKAICCIQMNKLDEAMMNLGEVAYLNPDYTPSMHAIAYIFLRKGDFESAMDKWLAIKTIAPKDPQVNTILQKVKNQQIQKDPLNRYNIQDFIQVDTKELKRGLAFTMEEVLITNKPTTTAYKENLKPNTKTLISQKNKKPWFYSTKFLGLVILLFIIYIVGFIYKNYKSKDELLSSNFIKLNQDPVLFSFQEEEIQMKKQDLLELIKTKDYNKIVISLNELYYSNAPIELKQEIKKYKQALNTPKNVAEIGLVIPLSQILQNPLLYQGVFIEQEGIVGNFLKRPQYITFDLVTKGDNKTSNIYFFDQNSDELPFNNKDSLKTFGFIRLDENKQTIIENMNIQLVKTSQL